MGVPGVYFPSICQPMKNKFIIRLMVRTARLDLALFTSCTRTAHTKWKTGEFNTKQLINKKHNAREQHPSVLLLFISHWKAAAQCWAYIFILFSSQLCCVFHFITLARFCSFYSPAVQVANTPCVSFINTSALFLRHGPRDSGCIWISPSKTPITKGRDPPPPSAWVLTRSGNTATVHSDGA